MGTKVKVALTVSSLLIGITMTLIFSNTNQLPPLLVIGGVTITWLWFLASILLIGNKSSYWLN
jgi:hypothetical protein